MTYPSVIQDQLHLFERLLVKATACREQCKPFSTEYRRLTANIDAYKLAIKNKQAELNNLNNQHELRN